ncbi:MAG TPA: protoporphyrinogen oxidase [Pyrinomonadaceae bacterium]|nr:protoporphyrinogen oxidase [Pyrinomonadaceae bacterium]
MKRIVIIGGGITGLAVLHRLLERCRELGQSTEIVLLEASSRVGGVIQTDSREGFLLEAGPDCFISEKPEALSLVHRLGIDSHLISTNNEHRRSFIVRKGKLRAVPQGFQLLAPSRIWPFLTSDIFSFAGKARMAADLVIPKKRSNGNDDESLASFVRRRLGNEALARMAQPMIGGIYTADPERLSLRATFPRFLDLEASHRSIILGLFHAGRNSPPEEEAGTSGARYSLFLSFDQGMQLLVDSLAFRVGDLRVPLPGFEITSTVRLRKTVEELKLEPKARASQWRVHTSRGDDYSADAVCLALPAYVSAQLLAKLAPSLAGELRAIPYASTATVNLGYRREDIRHRLNGFGFVVPFVEKRSLIACTFSSVKFAGRAPGGCVLLRAFVGGALQPEIFDLGVSRIIARVRADLRDLLGIENKPLFAEVSKWARSMPQYELGHLGRVKKIGDELQKLPGLKIAGNIFAGAGIPDCIRSGEAVADELLESFAIDSQTKLN